MTIKNLYSILDKLDDICILTTSYRKIYYGRVINLPDYFLSCSIVSISVNVDDVNYPYFVVMVE